MAKINGLKRLVNLKHFSDFTITELISSFGMYESAIIDLADVQIINGDEAGDRPYIQVSKDVMALNHFLFTDEAVMLRR